MISVAPDITYSDLSRQITEPIKFVSDVTVTFGLTPDWVRSEKLLSCLSLNHKTNVSISKFCFSVEYDQNSFGEPPSEWEGSKDDWIGTHVRHRIVLANTALWLARPSPIGFEVTLTLKAVGQGSAAGIRLLPRHSYEKDELTAQDFKNATTLYPKLVALPNRGTLWTGIQLLWKFLHENFWEARFLLSWIVIETLYGPQSPQELSYRLAQRIAFFLGADAEDAKKLFDIAKTGYAWRSKVVHGLRLNKLDGPKSEELAIQAEDLIRRTLLRILGDQNLIDTFDSKQREAYLESLPFTRYQAPA